MNYFFLRTALHCSFIVVADACFSVFPLDVEYVLIAQSRTSCICVFVDTHSHCLRSPCVLAKKKKRNMLSRISDYFSLSLCPSFIWSEHRTTKFLRKKIISHGHISFSARLAHSKSNSNNNKTQICKNNKEAM